MLAGGDSGAAVVVGKSVDSLLVQLVAGVEDGRVMPAKGSLLSATDVGILRSWIDQGAPWDGGVRLTGASGLAPLEPRKPVVPTGAGDVENPVDRFVERYFTANQVRAGSIVDDRQFARRVYLDLVGLPPTPAEFAEFQSDERPDKRDQLVMRLLDDRLNYALHWMTFWSDLLRNSYRGTGFIDNGRTQITGWLFAALYDNKPYDQFVADLVVPAPARRDLPRAFAGAAWSTPASVRNCRRRNRSARYFWVST